MNAIKSYTVVRYDILRDGKKVAEARNFVEAKSKINGLKLKCNWQYQFEIVPVLKENV